MYYKSTRDSSIKVTSAEAVIKGLSEEGGLFIPESLPEITAEEIDLMGEMSYPERAFLILRKFFTDFTDDELKSAVESAYGENFSVPNATVLSKLYPDCYVLELFHGPTCAFKDMALQLLPYLMTVSAKKVEAVKDRHIAILTATSGDTGKAALEGFKNVSGTSIAVFYPDEGVSEMQKRQMITQEGENVYVCSVKGNFDDCQNAVKEIFTDPELAARLAEKNMLFSSANSINWGRLAPQIVYYISMYASLLFEGEIKKGEKINICVPTGNFGNILAAYYAKEMGLPVNKLICASNTNNILTDFIKTGVYDRNREFHVTVSPSMDILISSNLERLIYQYHLSEQECSSLKGWFTALKDKGRYEVNDRVKEKLTADFYAGWCGEEKTKAVIKGIFDDYSYLMDPHTAVAYGVYAEYREETGDKIKTVIAATASPYKFCAAVYDALGKTPDADEFKTAEDLEKLTNTEMPEPLAKTRGLPVRFTDCTEKDGLKRVVSEMLKV
ncbi:MAG: threonine synthase [Oscillospiraceae bacterium]|nr:threonine synthase [Oscillospiraceae bacterium]